MKKIAGCSGGMGSLMLALALLVVAVALFTGTASAKRDNNPGQPFDQLEAKLDAIEAKLDSANPIPADGTSVRDNSGLFLGVVEDQRYQTSCDLGPCTCFLDGIQASCSIVLACLDAGLCVPD